MKKFLLCIISFIFTIMWFVSQTSVLAKNNDKIIIDFLDNKSVTVNKDKYINLEGITYKLGDSESFSFENSIKGRKLLSEYVHEPLFSAILNFWDDSSAVTLSKKYAKISNLETEVMVSDAICIDLLTDKSVIFVSTKQVEVEGVSYTLGKPCVISYENSIKDREFIAKEIPKCLFSVVMAVWGDEPTVVPAGKPETEESASKEPMPFKIKFQQYETVQIEPNVFELKPIEAEPLELEGIEAIELLKSIF